MQAPNPGGPDMPLTEIVTAAGTTLNESQEIEWRCRMFARQHMFSSELELRDEINRMAHDLRAHHIGGTLGRRQEKIGAALIKLAQSMVAAKHAPPMPAAFNTRGELALVYDPKQPKHPLHAKRSVPHPPTKPAHQAATEDQEAEKRRLEREAHDRHVQGLANQLAEDEETFYLHFTRWLAASEEAKVQDELERAEKPNAAPLDEDKVLTLVASMLTYSKEADMMRRRLNGKYHIWIEGDLDSSKEEDHPGSEDDSKAWGEIDAVSPRDTAMATYAAAWDAIARQRFERLKARLAQQRPGRFNEEKEKQELEGVLTAQRNAGLAGKDGAEKAMALLPTIVEKAMAQVLEDLRRKEKEVWTSKGKIKREEREAQNRQTILELKRELQKKLDEVLSLKARYITNNSQLESLGGQALDGQQLEHDLRGPTRIQQTTPAWSRTK